MSNKHESAKEIAADRDRLREKNERLAERLIEVGFDCKSLRSQLAAAQSALKLAINTVECASIDLAEGPTKGQELPWYRAAKAAIEGSYVDSEITVIPCCPPHEQLIRNGAINPPLDNCFVCIRNERNELKEQLAAKEAEIKKLKEKLFELGIGDF